MISDTSRSLPTQFAWHALAMLCCLCLPVLKSECRGGKCRVPRSSAARAAGCLRRERIGRAVARENVWLARRGTSAAHLAGRLLRFPGGIAAQARPDTAVPVAADLRRRAHIDTPVGRNTPDPPRRTRCARRRAARRGRVERPGDRDADCTRREECRVHCHDGVLRPAGLESTKRRSRCRRPAAAGSISSATMCCSERATAISTC